MADALGQAMLAFWKGDVDAKISVGTNVAEEEELPASYFFREFRDFPEYERIAMKNCKGSVLDLGAGAGCHSTYLASQDFDVTSVDTSDGAIEVMQKRGIRNILHCSVFDLPNKKYDTILMLMNGVGMAGNLAGLKPLLLHLKNYLFKDGQILLDSTDIKYLFEDDEGGLWIDLTVDYYGDVIYSLSYSAIVKESFPWLYVDSSSLMENAEEAGFMTEILHEGEDSHFLARLTVR